MTDFKISALTSGTPVSADVFPFVKVADHSTAPAGAGGSDQIVTAAALAAVLAVLSGSLVMLKPSGDTSGATDAAAINAAVTAGATYIRLAPTGPWYIQCGVVVINASGIYIDAPGCTINAVGAGDMIDMHDTSTFDTRTVHGGGILGFPKIDGTLTTGNSCALHQGDIFQLATFAQVWNFTAGTTSKGVWFDNRYWICEQAYGRIFTTNCGPQAIVFDVNSGVTATGAHVNATGSYERSRLDLNVNQVGPTFDGVVIQNGAFFQDAEISYHGNFGTSTSPLTSAALRLNGSTPSGITQPTTTNITNSVLTIGVECDPSAGANAPSTIAFGAGGNFIGDCTGNIDFGAIPGIFASSNNGGQLVGYVGVIAGDPNLPTSLPAATTNVADGNQTISATTATAITSLALPVAAFTAYKIDLFLPHASAAATGTYTLALGGPAVNALLADYTLWTGTTATPTTRNAAFASATLASALASSATAKSLRLTGTIVFSAAGTLTVTGLKSSGASNLIITAGAYLELTPMSAP